ncbi:multiple epidermal growth factor-like domains protein 11 [Gigantopelta aegis]|uniref:multiple epidermal growth factor-like domains protein 11 n=1 Tax=Gigantopelta aegis TaxID=1735272 RepID=UPI001B887B81|nr:multiple epidermal growth factor-like domains protein 11 [Gigantopelta aegis]XP_041349695.1 multiple epidermal growth factor-like domains protein 11 [Gigantopelta aegis]XP_041349696.1 multiple epidermal growth factor-like domains protein 11 [Gigantopelta aegis]
MAVRILCAVLVVVFVLKEETEGIQFNTSQDLHHCSYCNGSCSACQPGYFGEHCHKKCDPCENGMECHRLTGNCTTDYLVKTNDTWAYRCADCSGQCILCFPGWYGDNCTQKCINCGIDGCNKTSGICVECEDHYCGKNCTERCSQNCSEGICHRDSGECLDGCQKGMWGDHCHIPCKKRCLNGSCNFDGTCTCHHGSTGSECYLTISVLPVANPPNTTCTFMDQSCLTETAALPILIIQFVMSVVMFFIGMICVRKGRLKGHTCCKFGKKTTYNDESTPLPSATDSGDGKEAEDKF